MFLTVAFTHSAAGLLHEHCLVIEMFPHQFFQARNEKCELNGLALDRPKPPISNCQMIGIDGVMAEHVLSSDQRADADLRSARR